MKIAANLILTILAGVSLIFVYRGHTDIAVWWLWVQFILGAINLGVELGKS